jgi:alkanesulfonate monooxygenase SsuD/methylene tetrahydromethanopterin reductase-like flavin-dependent oxidoreductase (luciferase family)
MMDEQVGLLRALWQESPIRYEGQFHTVDRAGLSPRSPWPIPLWFGGRSKSAFKRAARVGDGFTFMGGPIEQVLRDNAQLTQLVAAQNREQDAVKREMFVNFSAGVERWKSDEAAFRGAGGHFMTMRSMDDNAEWLGVPKSGIHDVEGHIGAARKFMSEMSK